MSNQILVTGSSGLVGSEVVRFFGLLDWSVTGIDNNMRRDFFGPSADTTWNLMELKKKVVQFKHYDIDIRDRDKIWQLFRKHYFNLIIHCAAQPSHDLAATRPFDDFDVNAVGTLNLLENFRHWCPEAVFLNISSNKVYGDAPNQLRLKELETRWDFADEKYENGINENFSIDQCVHSLFGVSKVAGDLMTQEYGRYFGLKTATFRGGCLTGSHHSGVELHGFLNYLVRTALKGNQYTIFGYKGKQVRDQLHSSDFVSALYEFYKNPKSGEVYNIGGGKENSVSIIEAISKIEAVIKKKIEWTYTYKNRQGDHICYYTDLTKFRRDYPNWQITHSLDNMINEIVDGVQI